MRNYILSAAALMLSATAHAAPLTAAQATEQLLGAGHIQAEWFTPEFLQMAPLDLIQAQLGSLEDQLGAFQTVETLDGGGLVAVYERGRLRVQAEVDAQGRLALFGAVPEDPVQTETILAQQLEGGRAALDQILRGRLAAEYFAPSFLSEIPAEELAALMDNLEAEYGAYQGVKVTGRGWTAQFERGEVPVSGFQVDREGRVILLQFQPTVTFTDLDEARAAFAALPGEVSLLVRPLDGGNQGVSLNAGQYLAVGSTFKLAILGELQARIARGEMRWEDELTLTDAERSLPSGTLQEAPAGRRYTLRDLADRMIRDSDNTATDLLMAHVGAEAVSRRLGQVAAPNTRQAFTLKAPENLELLRAYRAAGLDAAARRAVLAEAQARPLPGVAAFVGGKPLARDVEWFITTQQACDLLAEVAALPSTQLNPGVAEKEQFRQVSYKGGSETGVLNLTTQLTNRAGQRYCVSATWNDAQALNDAQFIGLYQGVLRLLE